MMFFDKKTRDDSEHKLSKPRQQDISRQLEAKTRTFPDPNTNYEDPHHHLMATCRSRAKSVIPIGPIYNILPDVRDWYGHRTIWLVNVLLLSASFPLSFPLPSLFSSPRYFFPSSGSLWGFSLQQVAGQSAEASLAVWHHGNRLWKQHLHACAQTTVNTNTDKCILICQREGHECEYKLGYPCAHGS